MTKPKRKVNWLENRIDCLEKEVAGIRDYLFPKFSFTPSHITDGFGELMKNNKKICAIAISYNNYKSLLNWPRKKKAYEAAFKELQLKIGQIGILCGVPLFVLKEANDDHYYLSDQPITSKPNLKNWHKFKLSGQVAIARI